MVRRPGNRGAALGRKKELRRRILKRVNAAVVREAGELHTNRLVGAELRSRLRASEGLELEGFSPFDVEHPTSRIDFGSLTTLPELLALAILNESVNMVDYHPQADEHLHMFLDTGRSMRYPLSRLYDHSFYHASFDRWPRNDVDACWPKPSLLKLIAGVILKTAVETGFTVRIYEFSELGLVEHPPVRRRCDLSWLCATIDESLARHAEVARKPGGRSTRAVYYEAMAARLVGCRGSAVVLGDFMGGACEENRRTWTKMVNLLGQRAQLRPLIVVRINHSKEVMSRADVPAEQTEISHDFGDRTYGLAQGRLEQLSQRVLGDGIYREGREDFIRRIERQAEWNKTLTGKLRRVCRGYVEVDDRDVRNQMLKQIYQKSWTSIRRR